MSQKFANGDRVSLRYGKFIRRGTVLGVPPTGPRARVKLDPLPGETKPETCRIKMDLLTKLDVIDGIAELDPKGGKR